MQKIKLAFFFIALFLMSSFAIAKDPPLISLEQLTHYISEDRDKVAEFKFLKEWGKERGVRVYLAGGTAAGFGIYTKQFHENQILKSQHKELRYFDSRFTFNYYDIYRSTQDADIVIDANETLAQQLEQELTAKFNYLQGSKSVWEVRLLKKGRGAEGTPGYKEPLLSENFLNQHSDSYSTGLIEVTNPHDGENVVRDVFDWSNQKDPIFLQDLTNGSIHYYYNPKHFQTSRYKQGINPEILSVIRVLTKSSQYGAELSQADLEQIRKVVDGFQPLADEYSKSYVKNQIVKNGLKLYWHSQDVDATEKVLTQVGLKQKLTQFSSEPWFRKKPLPLLPLGGGSGKTAAELGITEVAHETNSFLAYENITMSRRGHPNVFISRRGVEGEAAAYGDGFYTAKGRTGARGTGLTIRFKVNPNAVEGADFFLGDNGSYIIFQNKAALEIIDESVRIDDILSYFHFISTQKLTADDLGLIKKMELKIQTSTKKLKPEEIDEIFKLVMKEISDPTEQAYLCFSKWMALKESTQHQPSIALLRKLSTDPPYNEHFLSAYLDILNLSQWKNEAHLIENFIDVEYFKPYNYTIAKLGETRNLIEFPKVLQYIETEMRGTKASLEVFLFILPKLGAAHPEWVDYYLNFNVFPESNTSSIQNSDFFPTFARILVAPGVNKSPKWDEWVEKLFANNRKKEKSRIIQDTSDMFVNEVRFIETILGNPASATHPEWIERFLKIDRYNDYLIKALAMQHWIDHPKWAEWITYLSENHIEPHELRMEILTKPEAARHPEWLMRSILKNKNQFMTMKENGHSRIYDKILALDHWKNHPYLRQICNGADPTYDALKPYARLDGCKKFFKKLFGGSKR